MIGPTIRRFLPEQDLLSYLEAILRVYNLHGRRDNKYKARIKILVFELGAEEFTRQVEAEWERIRNSGLVLPEAELARISAFFAEPPYESIDDSSEEFDSSRYDEPAFSNWARTNVDQHRHPGYAIVTISLKPHGGVPGDASARQMEVLADLAERYSFGEIRVSHEQNLVLPHVRQDDLFDIWGVLNDAGLATANAGLLTDIIACPGLDYCTLANARSIPVAQKIARRFDDDDRLREIGDLKIKISGCINACGHHHAGHIGILGVDRKGEELYQLMLGGSATENASLAKITGRGFSEDGIVDAVETVVDTYLTLREEDEDFLTAYRRLGMDPFKSALYQKGAQNAAS